VDRILKGARLADLPVEHPTAYGKTGVKRLHEVRTSGPGVECVGHIPEDGGAGATRRLRQGITLICAGRPGGPSCMTVVRRELPPSQGARVAGEGVAEGETRTLQSCRHRLGAADPREAQWALRVGGGGQFPTPRRPGSISSCTRSGSGELGRGTCEPSGTGKSGHPRAGSHGAWICAIGSSGSFAAT
jgi:hypothetical protein